MSEEVNVTQYLCRYNVGSFVMMLGDQRLELNNTNIISIIYSNNYDFNIRPILKVSLRLDIRRKLWILKNKRDIVVKFEMNFVGVDTNIENAITSLQPVWNQEFSIYLNEDDESIDVSDLEKRLSLNLAGDYALNDIETESYNESQNFLDIYLFNQTLIDASMNTVNKVFTSNTLQQCVGRILTASKHRNVVMTRFDNSNIYSELLVPALPAYKALVYLDEYCGFYKTGAMIYYDIDAVYILNTDDRQNALRNGQWGETVFMIQGINNAVPGDGMAIRENEKVHYVAINDMRINIQKQSISQNVTTGSDIRIVVIDSTDIDASQADQSYISQQNQIITYKRKDDNVFSASIMKARMEESEFIVYITADNLDVNAFKPNMTFRLVFEETLKQDKYGNYKYRLSSVNHVFFRESESFMKSSHQIVLKRCSSVD